MKRYPNLTGRKFFDYSKKTYGEWEVLYPCDGTNRWFACLNADTGKQKQFTVDYITRKEVY